MQIGILFDCLNNFLELLVQQLCKMRIDNHEHVLQFSTKNRSLREFALRRSLFGGG
jgi:hypothetical protein